MIKRLLLAAAVASIAHGALADPLQYTDTTTNASGQSTQGPVSVTPAKPLPVGQKAGVQAPLGYQQITSLSSAATLTVPAGATIAYVTVETQGVRWRDDGTAPTASVGMPVQAGQQLIYSGNLAAIQFIQQAASAAIDVAYYQ